jgi:ribosomal protein L29
MKQKEVKELSIDELKEKLVSFKKELSDLKMTHAI